MFSSYPADDIDEQEDSAEEEEVENSAITWRNWTNLAAMIVNMFVTYSSLTGIYGETNTTLSKKYQTLITPAGWAFSIWGPIFIWELVFVIAQFFPHFRNCTVTRLVSPWWWALCFVQSLWTFAFAQDVIPLALVLMLSILATLLGISWCTDGLEMKLSEYFLLRAPFSLQLGWIIAASLVNLNVLADSRKASQGSLLALAIGSLATVLAVVTFFSFGVRTPDAIVGLVAAWACAAIYSELGSPEQLNDPSRFNPSVWDPVVLDGFRKAAMFVSVASLIFAVIAALLRLVGSWRNSEAEDIE